MNFEVCLTANKPRACNHHANDGASLYIGIFAQFMTMWEKQILARAVEIQKENWGNHAFFRDNKPLAKPLKYITKRENNFLLISNRSKTRKSVSSDFQTPRSRMEKRGAAAFF